jgi:magnesium transporter
METQKLAELVEEKIESKDMDSLKHLINSVSEIDLLDIMQELSSKNQAVVFRLLSKAKALYVFEQLDILYQEKLIHSFAEEAATAIVEELAPDDRVRLFDELPAKVAEKMLAALSPEERQATNLLMGYEQQTAGRIMTTEYVHLKGNVVASEALEMVKEKAKDKETIYTLYITDTERKLEGVLALRDLLIANPDDKVETIMRADPVSVSTDTDQESVARLLQRLDLLAIPVVDKENRLVGIITVDDAMDILEEESTEDMFRKAGITDLKRNEEVRSEVVIHGSLWKIWSVRFPFLLLTLAGGLLAGSVIGAFEEVLEAVVFVAIFIPVIMDMGGNVGIQSSTVFLRGFLLGHIRVESLWKHIGKEVAVGLSMGIFTGVVAGGAAWIWQGVPGLGIAVGLSLVVVMTFAAFLGFIVPYVLMKLSLDQASGTDPIITTIKDITGLLTYFALVNFFMGHLL